MVAEQYSAVLSTHVVVSIFGLFLLSSSIFEPLPKIKGSRWFRLHTAVMLLEQYRSLLVVLGLALLSFWSRGGGSDSFP